MTPSEKVALGRALEEVAKPEAEQRKRDGGSIGGSGGYKEGSVKLTEPSVRDRVASAVGMAGATYTRAKAVRVAGRRARCSEQGRHVVALTDASEIVFPVAEDHRHVLARFLRAHTFGDPAEESHQRQPIPVDSQDGKRGSRSAAAGRIVSLTV